MPMPAADAAFERAKTLFFDGLRCFEAGDFAGAERSYRASLDALPGRASTLINLAAALLRLDRAADALETADAALAVEPGSAEATLHRAEALQRLGRLDDALLAADRLVALDPARPAGWQRRAEVLERLSRIDDALAAHERVVALEPSRAEAWTAIGSLRRELQRPNADAAAAFREALARGADPELIGYYLASVDAEAAPRGAPRHYVEGLFDAYADEFDAHLVGQLRYAAHLALVEGLAHLSRGPWRSTLDLGCGTGLCGPLVRPTTLRLAGVDLSAGMLAKARALGVYDRLDQADLVEHLARTTAQHDLVLAADVFIYLGDLEPVFAGVRRVMPDGGVFCFSVEALDGADTREARAADHADDLRDARAVALADGASATGASFGAAACTSATAGGDFELRSSLRYAHARTYLARLAAAHGFTWLGARPGTVREDQRVAVPGLFVYLSAASAAERRDGS